MLMCNLSLTSGIIKLIIPHVLFVWASLVAQRLKRLPGMQETQVRTLGWEDALEKENGNPLQCSCLGNPTDRGGSQGSDITEQLSMHTCLPLQAYTHSRYCVGAPS